MQHAKRRLILLISLYKTAIPTVGLFIYSTEKSNKISSLLMTTFNKTIGLAFFGSSSLIFAVFDSLAQIV